MKPEVAYNYAFSTSKKIDEEQTSKVLQTLEYFGAERIEAISKFTGIYGLEGYTIEQLERMELLEKDPTTVSAELAEHDVIVLMVNRVGDHNGVMRSAAEEFDDETGRVLFFEINNFGDIYRRMVTLRRAGIQPSTLVLAAHSSPGQFIVADERDPQAKHLDLATVAGQRLVQIANDSDNEMKERGAVGYSMHGMRGMARLVENYMRPSRSIDDVDGDSGRKKIIFQACYAGQIVDQNDKDLDGETVKIGEESVISQLGKDLLSNDVKADVDIYGGPDGIQMHRTAYGVRYSGAPNEDFERTKLDAIRIRLANGKLTQASVEEIALRRT